MVDVVSLLLPAGNRILTHPRALHLQANQKVAHVLMMNIAEARCLQQVHPYRKPVET